MQNEKALYEKVSDLFISKINDQISPFTRAESSDSQHFMPHNPVSLKNYSGLNALWLFLQNKPDPRWLSLDQIKGLNCSVKDDAISTQINLVKIYDVRPDNSGRDTKVFLSRPVITSAVLYNGSQVNGLKEIDQRPHIDLERQNKMIETIISNSGVSIKNSGSKAFYNPVKDYINMPRIENVKDQLKYNADLMIQMVYWSGHSSRLNRENLTKYGTLDYAKEELRAEIANLMISDYLGINHNPINKPAYAKSWDTILKNDPFEIFRASIDAQKIKEYVLSFEHRRNIEPTMSFNINDKIRYNNIVYQVDGLLPSKKIQVTNSETGQLLTIGPKDGLYTSLAQAKNLSHKESIFDKLKFGTSPYEVTIPQITEETNSLKKGR